MEGRELCRSVCSRSTQVGLGWWNWNCLEGSPEDHQAHMDGDREPGWGVWQPVPSHPVSFCHVPGEVLPSIDYSHCKKILSYISTEPLLVQPVPIAPCLLVFSTRLMAALQVQEPCAEAPPGLLLTGRPDPAPWC